VKILFIAPRFHTNQIGIIQTLKTEGHEIRFLAVLVGPTEDHSLIKPEILPESNLSSLIRKYFGDGGVNQRRYFPNPLALYSFFKNFSPDIAIIRYHGIWFAHLTAICAKLTGCHVIFYDQVNPDFLLKIHSGSVKAFIRKIVFYSRLSIFKAVWMTPIPSNLSTPTNFSNRCYFIPFSVPVASKSRKVNQPLQFIVVGKYQPRKNHLLMLEAVYKLSKQYKFYVTFVGEVVTSSQISIRNQVEDIVKSFELDSIVTFQDNVPYSEMEKLYRCHDVFVLPASDEPASISVLEALGQGVPVICSDTCGTRTYIREGVDGFVFTSNDQSSLITILERFLSNPDICVSMSMNALQGSEKTISSHAYYTRFMEAVNKLIS